MGVGSDGDARRATAHMSSLALNDGLGLPCINKCRAPWMSINWDAPHLGKQCRNFLQNSSIQMECGHKIQRAHACCFVVQWLCACCAPLLQSCTSSSP